MISGLGGIGGTLLVRDSLKLRSYKLDLFREGLDGNSDSVNPVLFPARPVPVLFSAVFLPSRSLFS
jgi:hypothetical protein